MKTKQFSKIILGMMTGFWFLGAILGWIAVFRGMTWGEYAALDSVLLYIGAPMSGGVVSYMIKSAAENREKIRQSDRGGRGGDVL